MKHIAMEDHLFEPQSTLPDGSANYKCLVCGAAGNSKPATDTVIVNEHEYIKSLKCHCEKPVRG